MSRGLGDVYKRQVRNRVNGFDESNAQKIVSYTHLTLPTTPYV
ncbi:hypothetical protein JMUB7552_27640 [Staphylococcus aureus]